MSYDMIIIMLMAAVWGSFFLRAILKRHIRLI